MSEPLERVWGGQAGRCGYGRLTRVKKLNCVEPDHGTWKMVKGCGSEREPREGAVVCGEAWRGPLGFEAESSERR